jgi:hypothetical protein
MTKAEAYLAMVSGHSIRHEYYTSDEYIYLKEDGKIYDEDGVCMGTPADIFWMRIQKWENGWSIYKN